MIFDRTVVEDLQESVVNVIENWREGDPSHGVAVKFSNLVTWDDLEISELPYQLGDPLKGISK